MQADVGAEAIVTQTTHNALGDADAPPWFEAAFTQALIQPLVPINRTLSINYNLLAGDGHSRPFKVVPFIDGADPTTAPYNLPALVNVQVINELTGPQCVAYLNGYNLVVPHAVVDRRRAIQIEIGCATV